MKRSILMAGVAALAFHFVGSARAQTAAAAPTAAPVSSAQLKEVVVTASKRKSTVQKTSESITVITGAELTKTNTSTLNSVLQNTPGIEMEGGHNEVYIRGIGATSPSVESDVAVTADGVATGESQGDGRNATITTMLDVDRVEVERGPQGTLYGRNADAGVVNVVSNDPVLKKYSGSTTVKVGDYRTRGYTLIFNLPIFDNIAIRNAVEKETHDPYIHNQEGGNVAGEGGNEDVLTDRAKLLYQPSDNLKFLYTFNYYWDASNTQDSVENLVLHKSEPWIQRDDYNGEIGFSGVQRTISHTGDIDYSTQWADFSVLPAYAYNALPCDLNTETVCPTPTEQTTVEARISNPAGSKITWTLGYYYYDLVSPNASLTNQLPTAATGIPGWGTAAQAGYTGPGNIYFPFATNPTITQFSGNEVTLPTTDNAIFGQATIPVPYVSGLRAKLGFRVSDDVKQAEYDAYGTGYARGTGAGSVDGYLPPTYLANAYCGNCVIDFVIPPTTTRDEYKPFTYLAGVEYDATPTSMEYAQVSTGFKAGGVNPEPPVPVTDYAPERLTAFEVGTKSRFFENTLQINADAYYYLYNGYQESIGSQGFQSVSYGGTTYTNPYAATFANENAGLSTVKGLEAETIWQASPYDRLTVNAAVNNATLGKLDVPLYLPTGGFPPMNSLIDFNQTGKTMAFAPLVVISGTYSHDFQTSVGTFTPSIWQKFSTGYEATTSEFLREFSTAIVDHAGGPPGSPFAYPGGIPPDQVRQKAYIKTDLYLNYLSPNGLYAVNLYAKNIWNSAQLDYVTPNGSSISPPRTIGGSVTLKF